jgi:hypothetical protein
MRLSGAIREFAGYVEKARVDSIRRHADTLGQAAGVSINSDRTSYVVSIDFDGNGTRDADDRPLDEVVVVLDDGVRTEVTRDGKFRFAGVRLGSHTVRVLVESLPDEASLPTAEATVELGPARRTADAPFLAKAEKRPEIRKTFPVKK